MNNITIEDFQAFCTFIENNEKDLLYLFLPSETDITRILLGNIQNQLSYSDFNQPMCAQSSLISDQHRKKLLSIYAQDIELTLKMAKPSSLRKGLVTTTSIIWKDIRGLDNIRDELRHNILSMKYLKLYAKFGITQPIDILLYGPPGCGKTLVCLMIYIVFIKVLND